MTTSDWGPGDVVVVPFPFTDLQTKKRRHRSCPPAKVLRITDGPAPEHVHVTYNHRPPLTGGRSRGPRAAPEIYVARRHSDEAEDLVDRVVDEPGPT